MTIRKNRFLIILVGLLTLGTHPALAAKAPQSDDKLKESAKQIVSGLVLEVTSKTQKSKVETSKGTHRDRVYTIKVLVKSVVKGAGIKPGEHIEIAAWRAILRVPPLAGLQGHSTIPKKGDPVTLYFEGKSGNAYEPLLPNGIKVTAKAERRSGKKQKAG